MGSGGGGSQTTTTVDPVYNAGVLALSQEQQGWAGEMYNMFKYGVTYDPEEIQTGRYVDDEWIAEDKIESGEVINPEWQEWYNKRRDPGAYGYENAGPEPPKYITNTEGLEDRTLGEIYGYDPDAQTSELEYLQKQIEANADLLGLQTDVSKAELTAKKDLIPLSTDVAKLGLETEKGLIPLRGDVERLGLESEKSLIPERTKAQTQRLGLATNFMREAEQGIDIEGRMDRAQAEVQHGFKNANRAIAKNISSYGLDPSSGMFASQNRARELAEGAAIAGARTKAKTTGETEQFERKRQALQTVI